MTKAALAASRLPVSYVEQWCEAHRIDLAKVEKGLPVWQTPQGKIPLTVPLIEDRIAQEDPVVWCYLNLTERRSLRDEITGEVIIPAGEPWGFFEIQAVMARLRGVDLIVECGSGIGKTRDIVAGTLWEMDTGTGNLSSLIAGDADDRLHEIWTDIEFQVETNKGIGGGVKKMSVKPFRRILFNNGNEFEMRICGFDGSQFRGFHGTGTIRGDEVAKWKNPQQFDELWRAATPSVRFRLYSTPDGDYSSPFYQLCARARRIDLKSPTAIAALRSKASAGEEPGFVKINITKMEVHELWSEARAAKWREKFNGEQSTGWLTQVLGQWGTPCFSVFPMPTLRPNLKGAVHLPHYRMVAATIDREKRQVLFNASRLASGPDTPDGGAQEEMLAREVLAYLDGKQLGEMVGNFFPPLNPLEHPKLVCGADLGSSQDPSEFVFVSVAGNRWSDVFRLHLRNADWPDQEAIVLALDHASGHRVQYGFDNGSAGSALVQALALKDEECSVKGCKTRVVFAERLKAFGFGEYGDEIDIYTGEPVLNPDKKDEHGNLRPHRRSNKEFSTRVLERKAQAKELAIAWDGGAGNAQLSSAQLLVNHTWLRKTGKDERVFRGEDDHHVDARRQAALVIVGELRGELFIPATKANVATAGPRHFPQEGFGAVTTRGQFGRGGRISFGGGW